MFASTSTASAHNFKERLVKLYSLADNTNFKADDIQELQPNMKAAEIQYWCSRILQQFGGRCFPEDIPSLFRMLPHTKTNIPMFRSGQFRKLGLFKFV